MHDPLGNLPLVLGLSEAVDLEIMEIDRLQIVDRGQFNTGKICDLFCGKGLVIDEVPLTSVSNEVLNDQTTPGLTLE